MQRLPTLLVAALGVFLACNSERTAAFPTPTFSVQQSDSVLLTVEVRLGDDGLPVTSHTATTWGSAYVNTCDPYCTEDDSLNPVFRYFWYQRDCPGNVDPGDCSQQFRLLSDTTWRATITAPRIYASGTRSEVVVEVRERATGGNTGRDSTVHLVPAPNVVPTLRATACSIGTLGFTYPFIKDVFNPDSGKFVNTDTTYRRNPCTGVKEFKVN
jgi:hypothetical protein